MILAGIICLAVLLNQGTFVALAQNGDPALPAPVILTDGQERYPLGRHLEFLEDQEKRWTIEDITSPELARQFQPSREEVPVFGFSDSVYWVRFRVKNETSATADWRLEQLFANTQYVDLYQPYANRPGYELKRSGVFVPLTSRDFPYHTPVFILSLPPGAEQTFYLRFESGASMTINLILWSFQAFVEKAESELLMLGLFFGMLLVMIGYHLFLWFTLRDSSYLCYVWFVASCFLFTAAYEGMGAQYLWPNLLNWQQVSVIISVALMLASALTFTVTFLDTRRQMPRWHKAIHLLLLGCGLVFVASLFFSYSVVARPAVPLIVLTALVSLGAGCVAWWRGYRPAYYFVLAWLLFAVGLATLALLRADFLPSNPMTEKGFYVGVAAFVLLWSLALGDRINLIKQKQAGAQVALLRTQEEALHQKDEFTLGLQQANETLEQRVAERTQELQQRNTELQQEIVMRKRMEQALEQFIRPLQVLYRTTLDIGAELDVTSLLPSILKHAVELLDAERGGGIYLYDPDEKVLRLTQGIGLNQNRIGTVVQLNQGMAGRVFQSAAPLIVNDYSTWEGRATVLVPWPPSAVLGVPLFLEKQIIGVLGLFANAQRRTFSQEDVSLAQMFAAQVAVALQNARLYQQARQEITERKQAELQLQETNDSLEQRLLELTILHFISQTLTTVSDIQAALATVVHIVNRLFNTYSTSVNILDPASKEIKIITSRELHNLNLAKNGPDEQVMAAPLGLFMNRLLNEKRHLLTSPTSPALTLVQPSLQPRHIQAFLFVPLQSHGERVGVLTLASNQPEYDFTSAEEKLAETIAGQITGAVKIAQLFEQERRQGQLAESLRQIAAVLSSSLDRSTILNIIFEQLQQVLQYDEAAIGMVAGDELVFVQAVGRTPWQVDDRLPLKSENVLTQVLQQRQVVILTNVAEAESWPSWFRPREPGSWMGAPLGVGRIAFGLLTVRRDQVGAYRQEDAKILQTFANQAALAIENTRLYAQAQTAAIGAERQRLARELHDSVTQSLYSLTLFTGGWAAMAQRGESDVPQMVKQFKQLEEISVKGLKEMRLLLHQLRPPILEEVGLVGALQQRLDAVEQRVKVNTRLLTHGAVEDLPLATAEQLFAIAQEALTNILRHAEASEVIVLLQRENGCLTLSVTDNGVGFDPAAPSFGLGLASIRERTETLGGQVEITSIALQGTTVMVTIDLGPEDGYNAAEENI
jgi:signal transduction histidine kinase